ncbi:MAG TPA: hypothetical protein VE860_06155 [Chthoniobacterales bacterium]|nr:hypothetical protein [Chthoniobacterales bacterium]
MNLFCVWLDKPLAAKQSLVSFGPEAVPPLSDNLNQRLEGDALRLTVEALQLVGGKEACQTCRNLEARLTEPV